jgi:CHAT domain-containing protein
MSRLSNLVSFARSVAIAVALSFCLFDNAAASQNESPLDPGKGVERSIDAGEAHYYTLPLTAGQYAHIAVDQRGVDVVVSIFAPDGTKLVQVDCPNANYGLEPVSLVADTAGTYRVEIRSTSPKLPGRYEVKLEELRAATGPDRSRIAAQKLFIEAKALRNQRTQESYKQALEKYESALVIWHNLNDKLMEAFMLHEAGMIYGDIGLFQKALDAHLRAAVLYKELKLPRLEASVFVNIGWVYGELDDTQKRLEMYDRAAEIYRTVGDIDPVLISNFGSTYARLGQYQRALDIHLRVLEMRRSTQDKPGLAITLSNIGDCYEHLGDKAKALDFFFQSLELMRQGTDHFYTAWALIHIGMVYHSMGQNEKALDYLNETLKIRQSINDRRGIALALFQIARVQRDRGNLSEARKRIEEALEVVEGLRTKIASQQLRASFFASMQQYREFYVDLLLRLHKENPSDSLVTAAFNASETGRARSLLELLREANTEIRHGVDPALLERERTLAESIADKAQAQMRLVSGEHTEEQTKAVAKELAALTTDYEQVQSQIREASPQYAALVQPVPLTVAEIQQKVLDRETLLLEYSLGEEKSFLWAVTPDSIKTYELPNRAAIEPLARRVYGSLTARNGSVADAEYAKAAATLSQILLGPVAAELKNKRLLVVSDGVLQFVPFAVLPDPVATDSRPLIIDHEVATAPSASVVALLRQQTADRKPAPKALAVFADPVFSNDDSRVSIARLAHTNPADKNSSADVFRSMTESGLTNLRRLRFSRREADEIARLAASESRLEAVDFEANRKLAMSTEMGQYRVVHFATHGLINNQHSELSGIVLSLIDEQGKPQNGFLRLYDLYNLKLSADLVVLSACQTALGKEIKGEGLVGLTRGFMYAGAPRVIASLWQIDDRASAEFMKRFYQGMLVQKLRPAAALRAAQISMQKDKRWNAPHYWAAFTLQGEWR